MKGEAKVGRAALALGPGDRGEAWELVDDHEGLGVGDQDEEEAEENGTLVVEIHVLFVQKKFHNESDRTQGDQDLEYLQLCYLPLATTSTVWGQPSDTSSE